MEITEEMYERMIGQQAIQLAVKDKTINDCLSVIHRIKTGEIDLAQLVTTETSFSLRPASVEDLLQS